MAVRQGTRDRLPGSRNYVSAAVTSNVRVRSPSLAAIEERQLLNPQPGHFADVIPELTDLIIER